MNFRKLGLIAALNLGLTFPVYSQGNPDINCNYYVEKTRYSLKLQRNFSIITLLQKEIEIASLNGVIIYIENFENIKANAVSMAEYLLDVTPKYESLGIFAQQTKFICNEFKRGQILMDEERENLKKLEGAIKLYKEEQELKGFQKKEKDESQPILVEPIEEDENLLT